MTLIAGFHAYSGYLPPHAQALPEPDAVVLAADSEEGGLIKTSVRKIAKIERPGCKCFIGGAGHGDFIDLAVELTEKELVGPYSRDSVREVIEAVVTDIYANRIDQYPPREQEDKAFTLLCAIWIENKGARLLKVDRAFSLTVKRPTAVGTGTYLARYLFDTLYNRKELPLLYAWRFAAYLLAQAKLHVDGCGGNSQIVYLRGDGFSEELYPNTITVAETSTSIAMRGAGFLFLITDPWINNWDETKINGAIDTATELIKGDMARMLKEHKPPPPPPSGSPSASASPSASPSASASPSPGEED